MAKMFYTLEETKASLGRNEEGIKQLTREGRLREFRDGPRLMFKADQVEQLKSELGGGGGAEISLSQESEVPLGLADTGSTSRTGSASALDAAARKEDTAVVDIGLSGSVGGIPSPGRTGSPLDSRTGSLSGMSNAGSRSGINVLDADDSQRADPSAQTAVGAARDNLSAEGIGSGSGLLDLTRESDDTSLGAVFDELTPGAGRRTGPGGSGGSMAGLETKLATPSAARTALTAPIPETTDPSTSAVGGMALVACIVAFFGVFVVMASARGLEPSLVKLIIENGMIFLGGTVLAILIAGAVGYFVGKRA
jgi:hypothetical protein